MSETNSPAFRYPNSGICYFSRRNPTELEAHDISPGIAFSLRTGSARIDETKARREADQLDEYWSYLRSQSEELLGKVSQRSRKSA
ncbi:DUF6538 domain-containing protein [Mesobacterium pallidum]|uniref:DUF6538 domain-containing protein n=1 Tax=Mesobacterium pallidum TaxID=2872037 RepID=UPI00300D8B4B